MSIEETIDGVKSALAKGDEVTKASTITTATGLVYYDLQAPSKKLYPVNTPLIKRMSRNAGAGGIGTNWRAITGIVGSGYDAMGYVPEGQRSAAMSLNEANKSANYVTIGEESEITFEAVSAAQNFEDLQALSTRIALQKLFLKEENMVLGGNASLSLGTPSAPALSAAGTGATLPAATYSVIVVALTLEGYLNAKKTAPLSITPTKTITGQDGKSFIVNGGNSNKSTNATQAVTLGQTLSATATVVTGAVAYAWFVGTAGSEKLEAITTINSATFSAPLAGTGTAATAITADNSNNGPSTTGYACDGLLYYAFNSANNAYVKVMANGTAGTGTPLTSSGRGSVNEIDDMLVNLWNNYQISPTSIWANAQEQRNITAKVLANNGAPLVRFPTDGQGGQEITASGVVRNYYNPFTADEQGQLIPLRVHPTLPPGTILAVCENLPAQYQSPEVPNVAEIKTRRDYYQIDWPQTTRSRQFGVYSEEVLVCYAPFTLGVITNIGNG